MRVAAYMGMVERGVSQKIRGANGAPKTNVQTEPLRKVRMTSSKAKAILASIIRNGISTRPGVRGSPRAELTVEAQGLVRTYTQRRETRSE